jgi:hypothetical protein
MTHKVAGLILIGLSAIATAGTVASDRIARAGPSSLAGEPDRIGDAIRRGMEWLQAHPADVDGHGVMEVAEEIMFYYSLRSLTSAPAELQAYRNEIAARHAAIESFNERLIESGHHLQGVWGPLTYLPLTHIITRMEMDAGGYRAVVDDILAHHGLLNPHRDAMRFWIAAYMERLGYTPSTPASALLESGLAHTPPSEVLRNRLDLDPDNAGDRGVTIQLIYDLTHEVLALTDFGASPPPAALVSLREDHARLLDRSIRWAMQASAIDVLAELVVSAHLLALYEVTSVPDAIAMILRTQQTDGSFGITNPERPNGRRHGVLTCLLALKTFQARHDRPSGDPVHQRVGPDALSADR